MLTGLARLRRALKRRPGGKGLARKAQMWVNRGMPPFDPSRLTPREKDELIRDLARVVEAQATRIAALEARLAAAKPPKTPANSSLPPSRRPEGHQAAPGEEAPASA